LVYEEFCSLVSLLVAIPPLVFHEEAVGGDVEDPGELHAFSRASRAGMSKPWGHT
jgi:hypothetical protein